MLTMIRHMHRTSSHSGFTLLEVLITVVILAIGLLGLAGLQMNSLNAQIEAYQRSQALLLLEDMANRIRANSMAAIDGDYTVASDYGLQAQVACDNPVFTTAQRDLCEWNLAVAGVGVRLEGRDIGSAAGALGCIENVAGSIDGETIIRLTIAWQGMTESMAPVSTCGQGQYGDDRNRRVISIDTVLADLAI